MRLEDKIEELRNKIVVIRSKKTRKNCPEEEERMTKEFLDKTNYETKGFPNHINK